jgi:thiamine-phosphate pyrophosphorylase
VLAGADFILVGDAVWADPRGASAALAGIGQAMRQAHAAAREAAGVRQA